MSTIQADAPTPVSPTKPQHYRFSVLLTAIPRFFRGIVPFVAVIVVNALVQALLVGAFNPQPGWSATFILTLAISFFVLVGSFYFMNLTALSVATGKASLGSIFARSGSQWGKFVLWAVVVYLLVLIGLILNTYVAFVVLLVFPFVTLAAADDKKNPIAINFRVIGGRAVRYIITALILGVILILSNFFTSVNGFFVGGWQGAIITWLYWGVYASWVLTALALIYRSTIAGATADDLAADPTTASSTGDAQAPATASE
ncbi:MAG: hypothetical protein WC054_06790 [Candidatus Nanopelagicales bacterium]